MQVWHILASVQTAQGCCTANRQAEHEEQTADLTTGSSKKQNRQLQEMEGPPSLSDMLEQDDRKAKRVRETEDEWIEEPTICLGIPRIKSIKISSLGPILKKRFVCAN